VLEFREARVRHVATPSGEVVVSTVAPAVPAFIVFAMRIGTEQHARGFQCGVQLSQHAGQFLRRDMK